jgi:phosphoribosylanthranilate isomerase
MSEPGMALWIKICGITNADDALQAIASGADAIGLNFVESSKRRIDVATGTAIRKAVGDRADVVGVVADRTVEELRELRRSTGIEWLQLHGSESSEILRAVLPRAYKAVRIAAASDVNDARSVAGERLLVDAKVDGELGGTGQTFEWTLVRELAVARPVIVAGGLTPDNVADAVRVIGPFGIDVASGVESSDARKKDPDRVLAFVRAARRAEKGSWSAGA